MPTWQLAKQRPVWWVQVERLFSGYIYNVHLGMRRELPIQEGWLSEIGVGQRRLCGKLCGIMYMWDYVRLLVRTSTSNHSLRPFISKLYWRWPDYIMTMTAGGLWFITESPSFKKSGGIRRDWSPKMVQLEVYVKQKWSLSRAAFTGPIALFPNTITSIFIKISEHVITCLPWNKTSCFT